MNKLKKKNVGKIEMLLKNAIFINPLKFFWFLNFII